MNFNNKKSILLVTSILLASFFAVSFFGFHVGMGETDGQMIGCPYKNSSAGMCPMAFQEHLIHWSLLFSAMAPEVGFVSSISFGYILFLAFFFLAFYKKSEYRLHTSRGDPTIKTFLTLLNAFRRGIIHSKLYA